MTRRNVTEWTCDLCGRNVQTDLNRLGAPDGWVGLAVNLESADGSWDHEGWERFHVCQFCGPEPGSHLGEALSRRERSRRFLDDPIDGTSESHATDEATS